MSGCYDGVIIVHDSGGNSCLRCCYHVSVCWGGKGDKSCFNDSNHDGIVTQIYSPLRVALP